MITFTKLRYRNILSTGNEFTEIFLNKSPTTLITGKNGHGKCVLINTPIRIKNKSTGEVRSCTIGDLYEEEINKTRED